MKLSLKMLAAAALATASTGCSSFLDVNTNPNSFTTASAPAPSAILAQALNTTASLYSTSYNSYASWAANYWAKSGVVSGYAEERTYNYTSSYYSALWSGTYDNLNDYNIIQQGAASYPNHAAIARIMKVYDFLLLVDEYGDIPYSQALKGASNLNPTYDKAADIYRDLIVQLKGAITDINNNTPTNNINAPAVGAEDIVFGGGTTGMTRWKQFANSLQLRILLRESQTNDAALNTYVAAQMTALQSAADGFITTDVLSNPVYAQSSGQQNPLYNRYGVTFNGTNATERYYQFPSADIIAKYLGNNTGTYQVGISDPRITVLYTTGRVGTVTRYNGSVAGDNTANIPSTAAPNIGSRFILGSNTTVAGILKGLNAPTPLMLVSEQHFNRAEAETRGLFSGGETAAKASYNNGVAASFMYFFRPATTAAVAVPAPAALTTTSTVPGISQYATYMAAAVAAANPLVSYDNASTNGTLGRQSIILYQKYLAMNSVASTEGWADYRRAARPSIPLSREAAQNKFPKRLLYPLVEVNTNQTNLPKGVDQYAAIFWDVVD